MKNISNILAITWSSLFFTFGASAASAQDPSGVWLAKQEDGDRQVHIRVTRCGPTLCNEIVWVSKRTDKDGNPLTDKRNANPKLRSRPILGLTVLIGMRESDKGVWRGQVYSPERGKVFKGKVALVASNKLKVTGCKKVAFVPVCKSRTWTRVSN